MKSISVKVQSDHIERLASAKSPLAAIFELVWNSLDADATQVNVTIDRNALSGIESIRVTDNGNGLKYSDAETAFTNLGGSNKPIKRKTSSGRIYHGKLGQGRFKAFFLGNYVKWSTKYRNNGDILEYVISADKEDICTFKLTDPVSSGFNDTGTEVEISGISKKFRILNNGKAEQLLTEEFALYLRQYPNTNLFYDGSKIDPAEVEDFVAEYDLPTTITEDGTKYEAKLSVIEWKIQTERALHLCDENGISLHVTQPRIQAPGFSFTAYIKSDLITELDKKAVLTLEELQPDLKNQIQNAKKVLRDHFRERNATRANDLVEQWKKDEIYPYEGTPKNNIEEAERQVFDVLALNVQSYLPDFEQTDVKGKRFTFSLIKEALESNPSALQKIIKEALELPFEKQEEFANLLSKTTLEAIINASKVVTDRLDFLAGLEILVFDPQSKKQLLERKQLHKIIADQTWIFGEEFNLTSSDKSLTDVLKKHLNLKEIQIEDTNPVLREDGSVGIIDLMLSRLVPQTNPEKREHLIIELKRPIIKIGPEEITQIKKYAFAIAGDERFSGTDTKWHYWAISNEINEYAKRDVNQKDRPPGLLYEGNDGEIKIWVKTWGQLINECKARLNFFQEKLEYRADEESALQFLKQTYDKYLPGAIKDKDKD